MSTTYRVLASRAWARGLIVAGIVATVLVPAMAPAQPYPNRPLKLIVPFPAGGPTDIVGRAVAQALSQRVGQPVVVDNKPGAGSTIGTDLAAKSAPDGYTLLLGSSSLTINPILYPKIPYDALRDLAPITLVSRIPNVLTIHPGVQANTLTEFLALARSQPGKLYYGTSGRGTADHLIGVMFTSMAGIEMIDVAYKGSPQMLTDVMGGQLHATFNSLASQLPHIRSGKLRAIGVTTAQRSASAPEIPSLSEGVPGFDTYAWFGVFAPAHTPDALLDRLHAEVSAAVTAPEARERLGGVGGEPSPIGRAELAALMRDETQRWAKLVRESNLKFE